MKKFTFLTLILALILSGCSKFDEVKTNDTSNPNTVVTTLQTTVENMSDLNVSPNFDWKLTKTLNVQITLPKEDNTRLLYIYSQDGMHLYFKGHPEDASNILKTKITVPTHESVLLLKYGSGDDYPFVGADLNGTSLVSNLESSFKRGGHNSPTGDEECTGCKTKLAELYLKYNGSGPVDVIVYNKKGADAGPGSEILKQITVNSGDIFSFNDDNTNRDRLESEITIFVNNVKHIAIHVSCSQPIYAGMVVGNFVIVSGTDKNGDALESCDTPSPEPSVFECLTMWALDDNNPGNLYYVTLSDNVVHTEGDISGFGSEDMESLAIDEDGDFYFINVAGDDKLYKILFSEIDKDPSTAVNAILVGNTNSPKITNLTFIGNNLYGIGQTSKKVYQINIVTGNATEVGDLNIDGSFTVDGLTEGVDGTIYLIKTVNSGPSELWKFNSFPSGGISKVMDIDNSGKVESLAAHPNGFLYAGDDFHFFKIDPITETSIIIIDYESDIEGIDFYWVNELECTDPGPQPDPEPDCEDGNYTSTTFGGFTFTYDGMTENSSDGTSTWTYTITGDSPEGPDYNDLSYWALALCENHNVNSATQSPWEVGTDESGLNFLGIKFDVAINKDGDSKTFSFTLDNQYDVEPITVGFKAGDDLYYCQIFGPSCQGDPDPDPDPQVDGTFAVEDLWPGKGDYDINDLVIEYDFDITKDNEEHIEHITATFTIRAFGADLHNGFGFEFPNVDPSDIVSVSGYDINNTAAYSLAANGVENGQDNATFILYDDAYRMMAHPGSGIGVNTDKPAPYVQPITLTLEIEFLEDAVSFTDLDIGNFNPFIVINQNRNAEVHLPGFKPTTLADPSYFGTYDDNTDISEGRYYRTHDNLFWAINIPARFDYPVEKQIILGAYKYFADWAQGNGVDYADWYLDEGDNRNASVIY